MFALDYEAESTNVGYVKQEGLREKRRPPISKGPVKLRTGTTKLFAWAQSSRSKLAMEVGKSIKLRLSSNK